MFAPCLIVFSLAPLFGLTEMTVAAAVTFFVCWPLAWLAWSLLTPRWRLWAYERVENIEELKRLAVERRLTWPDGHIFGKTEIVSRSMREKLRSLEDEKQTARSASTEMSPS
jgi:hypothetical protein